MLIPPNAKRGRHSESENETEENEDRLSDLPDCILLHILSFLNAGRAVRTSMLSTRWKNLWKRIPTLNLRSSDFSTVKSFTVFVSTILTLRDCSISLHSLHFDRNGFVEPHLLKRVVNYAISHNVQQLALSVTCDIERIPSCLFSCQALTSLKLSVYPKYPKFEKTLFPKSLNLPALTSLHLYKFAFLASDNDRAEPFSGFNRLNSLIIENCNIKDAQILCISSATLVNLTMKCHLYEDFYNLELSSPSLRSLALKGTPSLQLCGCNLSSVVQVDIDVEMLTSSPKSPSILLSWLQELADIKSLIVSASTLQVLFFVPDLLKLKLPFLGGLKSSKVIVRPTSKGFAMTMRNSMLGKVSWRQFLKLMKAALETSPPMPDGIVDILLQNSLSAKVDIIDCSRQKEHSRF